MKKMLCLLLAITVFVGGCTSTTRINTLPSGATVYIDGQPQGQSPVTYSDTAVSFTSKTVLIKKDGYKDKTAEICKEDADIVPIIGGFFFLVPFAWSFGYPDSYTFELEPGTSAIDIAPAVVPAPETSTTNAEQTVVVEPVAPTTNTTQAVEPVPETPTTNADQANDYINKYSDTK